MRNKRTEPTNGFTPIIKGVNYLQRTPNGGTRWVNSGVKKPDRPNQLHEVPTVHVNAVPKGRRRRK